MSVKTERTNVGNTESDPRQAGIAIDALKIAFGSILSRILGLLREILLASLFSKSITDAWMVAFRLPHFLRRLLGEGFLTQTLVPILSAEAASSGAFNEKRKFVDSQQGSQQVNAQIVQIIVLIVFGSLAAMIAVWPKFFLELWVANEFKQDTATYDLAVSFFRLSALFIFCLGQFGFIQALLHGQKKFFIAALAPTAMNMMLVLSTLLPLLQKWGWIHYDEILQQPIYLMWGLVAGGFLQVLLVTIAYVQKNPSFYQTLGQTLSQIFFDSVVRKRQIDLFFQLIQTSLPAFLSVGYFQIIQIINMKYYSAMGPGIVSYVGYVDRLIELPMTMITVSLCTAVLPRLADLFVQGDKDQIKFVFEQTGQSIFFLNSLAAMGLYFFAPTIVELIFHHGLFSDHDVILTIQILKWSAMWVFLIGYFRLISMLVLIFKENKKFFWIATIGIVLQVFILETLKLKSHLSFQDVMAIGCGFLIFQIVMLALVLKTKIQQIQLWPLMTTKAGMRQMAILVFNGVVMNLITTNVGSPVINGIAMIIIALMNVGFYSYEFGPYKITRKGL